MHEMSLMRNVVDAVLSECAGAEVGAVRSVHLTIGELRDVIDQYVPGLFRYLARGTVAEHAEIVIEHTPVTVRCNACGDIFPIDVRDGQTWACPRCHERQNYRLFSGNEFRIDRIEVERASKPAQAETMSAMMARAS